MVMAISSPRGCLCRGRLGAEVNSTEVGDQMRSEDRGEVEPEQPSPVIGARSDSADGDEERGASSLLEYFVRVLDGDTECFRHTDLHDGRPSTAQFKEKLPWFLNALPSSDCAKGGYDSGIIEASSFRTYHTPVNEQSDFVNALRAARDFSSRMSNALKMEIFPYSVFYIFFEQYLDIWKTALINVSLGLGAVLVVCLVITCSLWTSVIILVVVAMIVLDMMGMMALLDIQLNAVSVVNLVMSIGIAVEFCVHITHAFSVNNGDRETRAKAALATMGASVFSGITLTKLVGVIVLRFAKSEVFVVYYFKMYLALVLIGFLHGLVFLPVVLSICGPPSRCVLQDSQEDQPTTSAEPN